ncbi:MAG TPA: DinB family protein [Planktothrix sp.]
MKDYFVRSFRYNAWANRLTLASLRDCPAAQSEAAPLIAHLLAAQHVWLSRLLANEPGFAIWPSLTLGDCEALAGESEQAWAGYLESVTDDELRASVDYRNSRGESFCNSVMDILTHVVVHGGYHRGQIAKIVVRSGGTPAVTDFIVFVRNGGGKN